MRPERSTWVASTTSRLGAGIRQHAEMRHVPIGSDAIIGAVLAHRRDDDAVGEMKIGEPQRREQSTRHNRHMGLRFGFRKEATAAENRSGWSVADFHAGQPCPYIARAHGFPQRLKKSFRRVIVAPAPAFAQLDHVRATTLRQCEPFARDAVVRSGLPGRHERPEVPAEPGSGVQPNACARIRTLN